MLPIALTVDCEPDCEGFFADALADYLHKIAMEYARNDVEWVRAKRYAFDEVCGGEWYEDLSDDG